MNNVAFQQAEPISLPHQLRSWSMRKGACERLFGRGTLLRETQSLDFVTIQVIAQAIRDFQQQEPNAFSAKQWQAASTILTCAQIAKLNEDIYYKLPDLLSQLDSTAEHHYPSTADSNLLDIQAWRENLHKLLNDLTWQEPFSAEWIWEIIAFFWQEKRRAILSKQITLLLLGETRSGITANATIELLEDGCGWLFPDPETMAFVSSDPTFLKSINNSRDVVYKMGFWQSHQDIRWSIIRQDDQPLSYLAGGSAGGAFALALVCLLSDSKLLYEEKRMVA